MDSLRRSRSKSLTNGVESSLLPPTKRVPNSNINNYSLTKSRTRKWSIDGFFKKVSSMLEPQSSSELPDDEEDINKDSSVNKRKKKKSKVLSENQNLQVPNPVIINNSQQSSPHYSHHSQSSTNGSIDINGKKVRNSKDIIKARVEAKRDQLLIGDTSLEENSNDEEEFNKNNKRRSRAWRNERYLRRSCNGSNNPTDEKRTNDDLKTKNYFEGDIGIPCENYSYSNYSDEVGVNPLVKQTLQYFSEYDKNLGIKESNKLCNAKRKQLNSVYNNENVCFTNNLNRVFPKIASRDHTKHISEREDQYLPPQINQQQRHYNNSRHCTQNHIYFNQENLFKPINSPRFYKNIDDSNINQNSGFVKNDNRRSLQKYNLPLTPPLSPSKGYYGESHIRKTSKIQENNENRRNLRSPNRFAFLQDRECNYGTHDNESLHFLERLQRKKLEAEKNYNQKNTTKNLEEALHELEEIYKSLELGDEELLDRAERRTMEELHYRGITAISPNGIDDVDFRRKTWAESNMNNQKFESEVPNRLRDDMAYRRMNPRDRPSSLDGRSSSLSNISYLMSSPIPNHCENLDYFMGLKKKTRRKEPDVTLDDVVFRSMHHANHTLKVLDPQPPFGIPLGPITTATESDYLHTTPTKLPLERSRSPYISQYEPDVVTDDLAFRNLRKDAIINSSRHKNNNVNLMDNNSDFNFKKRRAVKSLSVNLYGMINNRKGSPVSIDSEDQSSVQEGSVKSTSCSIGGILDKYCNNEDTEDDDSVWQKLIWDNLDINRNQRKELNCRMLVDDVTSNNSCDSLHEQNSLKLNSSDHNPVDVDTDKVESSCSNCDTESPQHVEPISEQEISVYKQLCQDLENLVEMSEGINNTQKEIDNIEQLILKPELISQKKDTVNLMETSEQIENDLKNIEVEANIKITEHENCELKTLDESKNLDDSKSVHDVNKKMDEDNKTEIKPIEILNEKLATKEVTHHSNKKVEASKEDETSEIVDEIVFIKNVSSIPTKKKVVEESPFIFHRVGHANVNNSYNKSCDEEKRQSTSWEGEINEKRCNVSFLECNNALNDMFELTAKYISYITNHIRNQYCIVLLFCLMLLFAIVTVP